jgi:ABC-type amino acid transport substrate-binding protein
LPGVGCAQPQSAALSPEKDLVVAIKIAPPFVMKHGDGSYYGIGIDLWRRVADRLQLRYGFLEQPDAAALIKGIAEGSYDVSFGALSVTADRAQLVDFTQPFFATGLGIAVPTGESKLFSVSRILLSPDFLQAVLILIGIALAVGFVVWLFERRKTNHFQGGVKGLGSGFWWSAVAMTQAGAAQDAPATLPGRFVAICWMIVSIIVITVFTASITSKLTKQELKGAIHGLDDLRFVRVGDSRGTATVGYLDRERVSHRNFPDPKDGLRALQEHKIDAFVYDRPLLSWMVMQDFPDSLRVLDFTVDSLNYAIAVPKGSRVLDRLNIAVLQETESDWWQQTLFQYLRKKQ